MFDAGILRDQLVFQQRVITPNVFGGSNISWVDGFKVFGNPERGSQMNCRFTIRYQAGIDADTYRILWDDKIWLIDSAIHDLKRTMLVISCTTGELQEVTHLQSTETEYVEGEPIERPDAP